MRVNKPAILLNQRPTTTLSSKETISAAWNNQSLSELLGIDDSYRDIASSQPAIEVKLKD